VAVPAASLRELADARGILPGAAVNPALLDDKAYTETLTRDFNLVVAENVMKLGPTRPTRESYNSLLRTALSISPKITT
jgi:endo-1,4-beta-xylanase